MHDFDALARELAPHYSRFRVAERLLFSGHSHQAWPDVAADGLAESFAVAADEVDRKWDAAFGRTELLRGYLRRYYDDPDGRWCLGGNTHGLICRWLSALDLRNKPRIVSTDGEFHSLYRQLHRLSEEGLDIVLVPAAPQQGFVDRIAAALDDRTAAIAVSRVYFETGLVNDALTELAAVARARGIPLLIDDYHGTNVVPLSLREAKLDDCYMVIGGYKYLQWGEGNCFLRFPAGCDLRPAITGWFASFATLEAPRGSGPTAYDDGDQRFASGTYDPASQFRAAAVVKFFQRMGLTPTVLRQQYLAQLALLREHLAVAGFEPEQLRPMHDEALDRNGGFLALHSPRAQSLQQGLMAAGMYTDCRGEVLRLGVAPYITADQIEQAATLLREVVAQTF